jgi:hypothetical protein
MNKVSKVIRFLDQLGNARMLARISTLHNSIISTLDLKKILETLSEFLRSKQNSKIEEIYLLLPNCKRNFFYNNRLVCCTELFFNSASKNLLDQVGRYYETPERSNSEPINSNVESRNRNPQHLNNASNCCSSWLQFCNLNRRDNKVHINTKIPNNC